MHRVFQSMVVLAVSLSMTACASMVQVADLQTLKAEPKKPLSSSIEVGNYVQLTLVGGQEVKLTVTSVDHDTLEGLTEGVGETKKVQRDQIQQMDRQVKHPERTVLLAVLGGAVAFLVFAAMLGRTGGHK